jgi:hypothetical protein
VGLDPPLYGLSTDGARCGTTLRNGVADNARPVGYWVATPPNAGTEGTHWVSQAFGGFYAGQFEASRDDATPTSAGSGGALSVRQGVVPWTMLSLNVARQRCLEYAPACTLMGDAEWTALAVWAMTRFQTVYGNDGSLHSTDDASVTWTADGVVAGRGRTGSGTLGSWGAGVNLTTHTGTTSGVYDLVGNVAEWAQNVRADGTSYLAIDDQANQLIVATPAVNFVTGLRTEPAFRRFGVPTVSAAPSASFGNDKVTASPGTGLARGGHFTNGMAAGFWCLDFESQTATLPQVGFRPMLRY